MLTTNTIFIFFKELFFLNDMTDTVQVQLNTEVYSSFLNIYINPDIYRYLINVGLGRVR